MRAMYAVLAIALAACESMTLPASPTPAEIGSPSFGTVVNRRVEVNYPDSVRGGTPRGTPAGTITCHYKVRVKNTSGETLWGYARANSRSRISGFRAEGMEMILSPRTTVVQVWVTGPAQGFTTTVGFVFSSNTTGYVFNGSTNCSPRI